MARKYPLAILLALLTGLTAMSVQAQVQRAFVSGLGNNANTATNCQVTAPCKTFAAAVLVVAANGEVVALDTAPYGSVTLTQSISLTAAPGVYAGISVFAGAGVTINTPNISVVLRGITINGQGGANGVLMDVASTGAKLSIENCVIANFTNGPGVQVNSAATLRIVNTLIRDSNSGIQLGNGATADISNSKIYGSATAGIIAIAAASPTTASVSDTIVSGSLSTGGIGSTGIIALSNAGNSQISVTRTTITNNNTGIQSQASVGTAMISISDSMLSGNLCGLGVSPFGGTAIVESLGNNAIRQNTNATCGGGSVTTVSLQ